MACIIIYICFFLVNEFYIYMQDLSWWLNIVNSIDANTFKTAYIYIYIHVGQGRECDVVESQILQVEPPIRESTCSP